MAIAGEIISDQMALEENVVEELPIIDVSQYLTKDEMDNRLFTCAVCMKAINKQTAVEYGNSVIRATGKISTHSDYSPTPPTSNYAIEDVIGPRKVAGNYCAFCDYALCSTCSVVYCRQGHECALWTFPEAMNHSCNICYKNDLKAGYHCKVCTIDICDLCTVRETRNVLLMIPKRDFKNLYKYMESNQSISKTAYDYCKLNSQDVVMEYMKSMSILCEQLRYCLIIKEKVDKEIEDYKILTQQRKYAIKSNDL